MADSNFIVKNGLTVNGSFLANSTQVSLGSNINISTTTISVGNSSVNATINSTAFSGSSASVGGNTASTLRSYSDSAAATAYTNAASYADTKAATAYTNAASYADTKAATAYTNAVAYVNTNSRAFANSTNGLAINGSANNISYYTINQNLGTSNSPTFANVTTTGSSVFGAYTTFKKYNNTNEGGKLQLELSNNSTLSGNVIVDNYNNTFRIFENGGSYRGLSFDFGGVGSGQAAILHANNFNNYAPTLTGTGASGTWSISITGNAGTVGGNTASTLRSYSDSTSATAYSNSVTYVATNSLRAANATNGYAINGLAATATLATKASTLSQSGGNGTAMTFNWSGQGGQPTWLWGSNDGSNIYVYNPSYFNVNSATYSAYSTQATNLSGGSVSATSGTFTGTLTLTGDGTNFIRMENSSGGYLQFKDNKDPDAGIYTYSLGMDAGRFYFYMNSTSNDFQLGYIKAYINQNGNIVAGGQTYDNGAGIIAGNGFASKAGYTGAYGNIFNIYWNGSQARLYIDDSDQGSIEVSSAATGGVGTYALAYYSVSVVNPGDTVDGSYLYYADTNNWGSGIGGGTWRCMGQVTGYSAAPTLFKRVA